MLLRSKNSLFPMLSLALPLFAPMGHAATIAESSVDFIFVDIEANGTYAQFQEDGISNYDNESSTGIGFASASSQTDNPLCQPICASLYSQAGINIGIGELYDGGSSQTSASYEIDVFNPLSIATSAVLTFGYKVYSSVISDNLGGLENGILFDEVGLAEASFSITTWVTDDRRSSDELGFVSLFDQSTSLDIGESGIQGDRVEYTYDSIAINLLAGEKQTLLINGSTRTVAFLGETTPVPLPASLPLGLAGIAALWAVRAKQGQQKRAAPKKQLG